jgi:6-phosphogluconolactonase (cycloisomerase 2 family)
MKKYQSTRSAFYLTIPCALVALTGLIVTTRTVNAQKTYIYGETNDSGGNAVFAYSNDGSGNMLALAGSPFLTGGTGVLAPSGGSVNDADQEVIANTAGTLLYAVDGHSNTIGGFTINADGSLTRVPGSPAASGGHNPVSLGLTGNFLIAVNKNEDPNQDNTQTVPNYTTFTVNVDGSLTMNPGSTLNLPTGSSPSQALVVPGQHAFFGMQFLIPQIANYRVKSDGTLSERASIGPPSVDDVFLGEILHPTKKIIYAGLPGTSQVGVYKYNSTGLSLVGTVPNNGAAICWLAVNSAGTRLYTSETESATITVYDLTTATSPVQLQQLTLAGGASTVSNLALDPTGGYLYALVARSIHVLPVDGNGLISDTLAAVTIPGPLSEKPLGLAVVRK